MQRKSSVTLHWAILLAVYWAVLIAGSIIALTSDLNELYFVLLLAAGIPVYFIAANAITRQYDFTPPARVELPDAGTVLPAAVGTEDAQRRHRPGSGGGPRAPFAQIGLRRLGVHAQAAVIRRFLSIFLTVKLHVRREWLLLHRGQ